MKKLIKNKSLGVCLSCFVGSGHKKEPEWLILENYRYRPSVQNIDKSIVRDHQGDKSNVITNSNIFETVYKAFNENLRSIYHGRVPDLNNFLSINYYVCQNKQFYDEFKKNSGCTDAGLVYVRLKEWWVKHDINKEFDEILNKFLPKLKFNLKITI